MVYGKQALIGQCLVIEKVSAADVSWPGGRPQMFFLSIPVVQNTQTQTPTQPSECCCFCWFAGPKIHHSLSNMGATCEEPTTTLLLVSFIVYHSHTNVEISCKMAVPTDRLSQLPALRQMANDEQPTKRMRKESCQPSTRANPLRFQVSPRSHVAQDHGASAASLPHAWRSWKFRSQLRLVQGQK